MLDARSGGGGLRLLHDGTFAGFLAAVDWGLRMEVPVAGVEPEIGAAPSLFEEVRPVPPRPEAARELWGRVLSICGPDVAAVVRAAFHSEIPGIGTHLWRHLERILSGQDPSCGRDVLEVHGLAVLRAAERTRHEAHRLQGFVRFSEASDGGLFAVVEPDHDVLHLLVPHFRARLPGERWILADARRGQCAQHAAGRVTWGRVDPTLLPRDSRGVARMAAPGDARWTELWRAFWDSVTIAERRNRRQQDRLLPRRYRRYLTETPGAPRP